MGLRWGRRGGDGADIDWRGGEEAGIDPAQNANGTALSWVSRIGKQQPDNRISTYGLT